MPLTYSGLQLGVVSTFFVVLIVAVYTDLTSHSVPNWLTYGGMALGIALHAAAGSTAPRGLSFAAGGFAVGFGIFLVAYALGMLQAGDVKLMGAVGALTGWEFTIQVIFYTAVVGGLIAMGVLAWHGMLRLLRDTGDEQSTPPIGPPVPIVKVEPPAEGGEAAAQPAAAPEPKEQAPLTIPYGLSIAFGGFIAFYFQAPRFVY